MKRNLITLTISIFAIALLPGCEKGDLHGIDHGHAELRDCPITQIIRNQFSTIDTLAFTYNSWGDPERIDKLPIPKTGSPDYVFKYDKKRRLTDVMGLYLDPTSGEIWHKYFYDNPGNGNITRDSAYIFFQVQNGVLVNYMYRSLTYYTYDKYDRIIKDSTIFSATPTPTVNTYAYDASGNRIGRSYDNKINMLRTNKIWMFYSRDYSVNNPFDADAYNVTGLPTQLDLFSKGTFLKFMGEDYYGAQITYDCK